MEIYIQSLRKGSRSRLHIYAGVQLPLLQGDSGRQPLLILYRLCRVKCPLSARGVTVQ